MPIPLTFQITVPKDMTPEAFGDVLAKTIREAEGMGTMDINSIEDLQRLVVAGETDWQQYGDVTTNRLDNLILFNYTQAAQFAGRWNWFERNSRGLILDTITGEVVARPFPKFFNYGERFPSPDARIVEVTEKMDGSLGILYRNAEGVPQIATRGSFTSDQAQWASRWIRKNAPNIWNTDPDWTLLFEIIYPQNRVVVNYGDFEGLVLIGARHRQDGHELHTHDLTVIAGHLGVKQPRTYAITDFDSLLDAAKALSANEEGWVIRMSDGERFKVKGDAYKIAHRLMTGVTFRRVLDAVVSGQYDAMIEGVPDEFLGHVKSWRAEIEDECQRIETLCASCLDEAPRENRKDFAVWVQATHPKTMHGYLFAALDGKALRPLIYRSAFKNRSALDMPMVQEGGAE